MVEKCVVSNLRMLEKGRVEKNKNGKNCESAEKDGDAFVEAIRVIEEEEMEILRRFLAKNGA